jgi:hypothetical protein
VSFDLPYLRPSLGTDTDFDSILAKCGQIVYQITNVDDSAITTFTPPGDSYGVVTVDGDTVGAAQKMQSWTNNTDNTAMNIWFGFSLEATFVQYPDEYTFNYQTQTDKHLFFMLNEACYQRKW